MTTLTTRQGSTRASGQARHTVRRSRLGEWLAGWRVALRLARRDSLAHKGRSALILAMISLPVMVMVAGLTGYFTQDIDLHEAIPSRMGRAAGVVTGVQAERVWPTLDGNVIAGTGCGGARCGPVRPLPGLGGPADKAAPGDRLAAVGRLLGARLVPMGVEQVRTRLDDRPRTLSTLAVDAQDPLLRGKVDLLSGRWPTHRDEVLVTESAISRGARPDGTLQGELLALAQDGAERNAGRVSLRVVGTARALTDDGSREFDLVRPPDPTAEWAQALVDRAAPVTWDDMTRYADHGVTVMGRAATLAEPAAGGVANPSQQSDQITTVAVLAAGLLIEAALLAGPAFAVIAQRQRRTLALAAANGATRAQLRRSVLAQAVLLGAVSSLLAAGTGLLLALVGLRWWRSRDPLILQGPFDVPVTLVLIVLSSAVIAAVVAALVPARGLGRLDVAAAMRGETPPRRTHRWLPALGLALCGAGGLGVFGTVAYARTHYTGNRVAIWMTISAITLVTGALLTVPAILAAMARSTRRLPVAPRMATRDAVRNRGRAVPTVAAIMAGTIVLSGASIAMSSSTAHRRATYTPSAPAGWLYAVGGFAGRDGAATAARTIPGGTVARLDQAVLPGEETDGATTRVLVASTGCSIQQAFADDDWSPRCPAVWVGGTGESLTVADDAALRDLLRLTPAQRRVIDRGGMLTSDSRLVTRPTLGWVSATARQGDAAQFHPVALRRSRTTPVGMLTPAQESLVTAVRPQGHAHVVGAAGAKALGVMPRDEILYVRGPGGTPVTADQQDAFTEALASRADDGSYPAGFLDDVVKVERGFQDDLRTVRWALLAVVALLILVGTTTATSLSMGEAQRDLATLAAVGSGRRTRRALAAAQAALLAVVGTVVGCLVGAVPGVALAREITRTGGGDLVRTTVVVPWDVLGIAVVGIPLLAALLALALVRTEPTVTRRAA